MTSEFLRESTGDGDIIAIPRVFNHFEVLNVVGIGSSAVVVSVQNPNGVKFAAKVLRRPRANDDYLKFLERELRLCVTMSCPYLVNCFDVVYFEDIIIVVMELCAFGDLMTMITEEFVLVRANWRKIFAQLCLGVQYLHSRGMAHRDLKLENILIDEQMNVKLCDYGFMCETKPASLSTTMCGSMRYVAPEVLRGEGYHPMRTDVWALGIVLYGITTGLSPWKSEGESGVCREILAGEMDLTGICDAPRRIVEKCCDQNQETRVTVEEILAMPFVQDGRGDVKRHTAMTLPVMKGHAPRKITHRVTIGRQVSDIVTRRIPNRQQQQQQQHRTIQRGRMLTLP